MKNEKTIGEELLKQNGIESGKLLEEDQRSIHRAIARTERRIKRLKWATIIAWSLLVLFIGVGGLVSPIRPIEPNSNIGPLFLMITLPLLYAAIGLTIALIVSLFLRSRSQSSRKLHAALSAIQEQLKQLSQDMKKDSQ